MDSLKAMKAFLALGDLNAESETLEQKVAYKERIVFSTMRAMIPNWEKPLDWDRISLEEKMKRLTDLQNGI